MRYTFIKQHDATDCAAACMGMVCLHYKKETTITKLRETECLKKVAQNDKEAKDELILHNMRLVAHVTKKYAVSRQLATYSRFAFLPLVMMW